jgi:hypothetical protein
MATTKKKIKKQTNLQTTKALIKHMEWVCRDFMLTASALQVLENSDPKCKKIIDEFFNNFGTTIRDTSKELSDLVEKKISERA